MARRISVTPTRTAQTRPPRRVIREFQDRGWRWIFSDIVLMHSFLRLVDPDTATRVDPTRAVPLERSFLPDDLELPETMRYQWLELVHFLRLLVHHRRGVRERPDLERRVVEATERSKFRRIARREMTVAEKTYAEVLRKEGEAIGEVRGAEHEARMFLLHNLRARFGEVSEALRARVEQATADWCHEMGEQAVRVNSLSEIRWI